MAGEGWNRPEEPAWSPGGGPPNGTPPGRNPGGRGCFIWLPISVGIALILGLSSCHATHDVMYKGCGEVNHPVSKGDPGYNPKLDRDHDGKMCEY